MNKRSAVVVLLLGVVTCGLYTLFWFVDTKHEMVRKGAKIPSAAWAIVPIANIWWTWEWAGGVDHATRGTLSQGRAFIAVFLFSTIGTAMTQIEAHRVSGSLAVVGVLLLNAIGTAIVQTELNKAIDEDLAGGLPRARVA